MLDAKLTSHLQQIVGAAHVSAAESVLDLHSRDQSAHRPARPDAVVWPADTHQVQQIVRLAAENGVPLVGWGAGSSLEGNPIPVHGGLVVNFARLNRILAVYPDDFQVVVQPGIFYKDMNHTLAAHGLFFAPDPGANASIGGMVANNAAGTRTPKYGATRDNVLALEVVLASGEVIRTGSRAIKQSAGYDLTHLFVGSEGTLGLVTEATLRLAPLPAQVSAATAAFATTAIAAQAVSDIIGAGLNPAALELLDTATVQAMNAAGGFDLPVAPLLLMEFHGASPAALEAELAMVQEICTAHGCLAFRPGLGWDARNQLWQARHQLGELLPRTHPGRAFLITDVAVPISQYPALVAHATKTLQGLSGVDGYIFGHAGDGNMHSIIFFADEADQYARVLAGFNDSVVARALELEGTCSGEHGVGIGKQKYLPQEVGPGALAVMRQIKQVLDPAGIMNPGKVIPE
jgi:D-lactate dehydrogenase (cytochrome)